MLMLLAIKNYGVSDRFFFCSCRSPLINKGLWSIAHSQAHRHVWDCWHEPAGTICTFVAMNLFATRDTPVLGTTGIQCVNRDLQRSCRARKQMSLLSESRKKEAEFARHASGLDSHTPSWRALGQEVGRLSRALRSGDDAGKEGVGKGALTA